MCRDLSTPIDLGLCVESLSLLRENRVTAPPASEPVLHVRSPIPRFEAISSREKSASSVWTIYSSCLESSFIGRLPFGSAMTHPLEIRPEAIASQSGFFRRERTGG
jgi:hypothetical protein